MRQHKQNILVTRPLTAQQIEYARILGLEPVIEPALEFSFPEYWDENTLLNNKVIEDIRAYNEKLMTALLSNELIRKTYSLKLPSGAIFKVEDFISMLRFKNYWDNSYTKYTNEIGLTSEGKYLKYNTDVVIDFPHKDSVLEGGMSSFTHNY